MILEAIKNRRSVRSYLAKEIPAEILREVMEAARLAPSARNRQPWKFVIIQNEEIKKQIMYASGGQRFIDEAPVVIAGCATNTSHTMPNGIDSYPVDLSIALEHICLQAAERGLGSCWIGAFDQEKVRMILDIPENVSVVALMTLGYPRMTGNQNSRKSLEDIICYNKYKE